MADIHCKSCLQLCGWRYVRLFPLSMDGFIASWAGHVKTSLHSDAACQIPALEGTCKPVDLYVWLPLERTICQL